MKHFNRRSPRHAGVYQRCREDCPADRCRKPTWSFVLEVPAGSHRRRQLTKGGFESAGAAAGARTELQRRYRSGSLPEDTKITVEQYLREWLAGKVKRDEVDENTEVRHLTEAYQRIVDKRQAEIAAAKAKRDARIAEAEAENLRRRSHGKVRMQSTAYGMGAVPRPVGPATLQRIHGTMRAAIRSAFADELIGSDVSRSARLPKPDRRKVVRPDISQFWTLLDTAREHRLYPLMLLPGNSGIRRGELAGLRWADIDLTTGMLVVRRQRKSVSYRVVEADAKSQAGQDRVVMLGERTIKGIKSWKAKQAAERLAWGPAYHDGGYVFTREDGTRTTSPTRLASSCAVQASPMRSCTPCGTSTPQH